MGAKWNGKFTGTFGNVGCFSTQTFKHINSGEGGILVTDDEDVAAKAILSSGCYMLYSQHSPKCSPAAHIFEKYK
jgi:dTDP-4-amino-4,6-dideoxygalactose transaminase